MSTPSTLLDLLLFRAQNDSSDHGYTFLTDGEEAKEHYSFQQLDQRARAIGACLQGLKCSRKQVLLLYQPGLDFIAAFFGCLYAGAIAVPAFPPRPNRHSTRIQAMVKDAEVDLVLTTSTLLPKLQAQKLFATEFPTLRFQTIDSIPSDEAQSWNMPDVSRDTLAFLQYTSGSTNSPKGVMVTHHNLLHNLRMIQQAFEHSEKTILVGWLPLFHDMGLIANILEPLWLGIPSILMSPTAFLQKPVRWLQAISTYRATTSGGPNFAYDLCVRSITPEQQNMLDLSCWDLAFNGSEPIRVQTMERFTNKFTPQGFKHSAFTPCYGLAEGTLMVSSTPKCQEPLVMSIQKKSLQQDLGIPDSERPKKAYKVVSSGVPWAEGQILIVHPTTCIRCVDGQIGEVWVKGPHVAQGYWNKQEMTKETFRAFLGDTGEGPFLRTGDLGFIQDEELYVTGRLKDLIIIRGQNHYPQDLEQTVGECHPAFLPGNSAAFAIEREGEEHLVVAQEIERTQLKKVNVEEIMGIIRERVSENHDLQVHGIALLKPGGIPKTSSGKIQRGECRNLFLSQEWPTVGTWVGSSIEPISETGLPKNFPVESFPEFPSQCSQKYIESFLINRLSFWLKLPPQDVDVQETLAHYGFDSSIAISLAGELGEFLHTPLDPTLLYDFPNIEAVARYLHENYVLPQQHSKRGVKFEGALD